MLLGQLLHTVAALSALADHCKTSAKLSQDLEMAGGGEPCEPSRGRHQAAYVGPQAASQAENGAAVGSANVKKPRRAIWRDGVWASLG